MDAEKYIDTVDKINPIFLFSIDYLTLETVEKYIEKVDKIFIAVHCNKPYLSKTSVYRNNRKIYYELHPKGELEALRKMFQSYQAETFKMLGEDFYDVSIIKKG